MKIKNYTTKVPAVRSIDEIEKILVDFGATHIMKTYQDGLVMGLAFRMENQGYQLPANVEGVLS